MNKSYIFAITLMVLIGIQLYQPTSAQSPPTTETSNAAIELENATSALAEITKSLQQNTSTAPTKVNATTVVNSIFESNLPALFIIVIFLVIIIPLVFDMYIVYKRSPRGRTGKEEDKPRQGMPGLYRSLMCFGVILLVGTVIFYLLALITLNINNTESTVIQSLIDLLKNLGTILGTALATIIAFYFGIRGAESSFTTGAEATTGGKTKPTEGGKTKPTEGGETKPTEGGETKPTEGGETKPTEGGETKPTEGGETKPTEGGETKPTEAVIDD